MQNTRTRSDSTATRTIDDNAMVAGEINFIEVDFIEIKTGSVSLKPFSVKSLAMTPYLVFGSR